MVHTFTSPLDAIKYISKNEVDLIFLDIQMPEISGIEFAETISQLNLHPDVIFVTAHDQYLLDALRVNALDYLLKPVDVLELEKAVSRVQKRNKKDFRESIQNLVASNQKKKLKFNTRNGFVTFYETDVLYIEADGVYSKIHLINGKEIIISQNLGKIEEQLKAKELIKIHRSVIVNANYIFEINRGKKECILAVGADNYKLRISQEGLRLIENIIC